MHETIVRLADVWKTCNKIRAAVHRVGLNLWEWYTPLDPEKNCLISESKFVSILAGPLRTVIGLSDKEISQLADYFRTQDGRVLYHQLCSLIHGEDMPRPELTKTECILDDCPPPPEPACHTLDQWQIMRLCCLLATIATRQIPLEPYFQDYELVSKNDGRITFAHFARILNYIGVYLSADDFNLLIRKFIKDSYTLDYVEFLKAVDAVKKQGIKGLETAPPPPKIFRPELASNNQLDRKVVGDAEHPVLKPKRRERDLVDIMLSVQKYVKERRIRVSEFFRDFDPLNCGRVNPSELRRVLDMTGITSVLSPWEILCILEQYKDPNDSTKVCWRTFEDDCDQVFTVKELERYPDLKVGDAAKAVDALPRPGSLETQGLPIYQIESALDDCERALLRVRRAAKDRSVDLRPFFKEHDYANNGHISGSQLRRVLARAGVLPPMDQIRALEIRYSDDLGVNYYWLLDELVEPEPQIPAQPSAGGKTATSQPPKPPECETDIVQILAKIKGKIVREGVRPMPFLRQYDVHNEMVVARPDFYRGLASAGLQLTPLEMDTVMEVFASPARRRFVDYVRFSNTVGEALVQGDLERAPLIEPVQHIPLRDTELNFLNFEERHIVSMALTKLAKFPDLISNIYEVFKDLDKNNCGTISHNQLQRALCQRNLLFLVSAKELDMIAKCFAYKRGCCDEINYRALSNAIETLYTTLVNNPC